jgi:multicomponent K+:H+ antiporter subunit D
MCCALLVAGLPPLSGFLAKLSLLTAVLGSEGGVNATGGNVSAAGWLILALLLLSGFAATVSLVRAGIRHLWSTGRGSAPNLKGAEAAAVVVLLASCVVLTVFAEPVMRYTNATAAGLHAPRPYIDSVLSTPARPRPAQSSLEQESSP